MILLNKYKLIEKIGNGEFGAIYKGENIRTKESVAVKIEKSGTSMLKREAQIYQYLGKHNGIPSLKWYGTIDQYTYLVLPLFSFSLNHIPQADVSLVSVYQLGRKMIDILEYIHSKGLIHRDIKPDNFCIDSATQRLYIIDFGLCKKYVGQDGKHILLREGRPMVGTPNYVSLNVHDGLEASRRDDLESVCYVLYKLLCGKLEWDLVRIRDSKSEFSPRDERLRKYLEIVRRLGFSEKPDYDLLRMVLS
jgi:serine/threonine protein kinase